MATKIIWMYWQQGWDEAPDLVKRCRASWIKHNPDYEVRALDQHSLFDYITFAKGIHFERKDLSIQKIANLGRLALLSRYGGVWTDATVMCTRPLDEWLEPYLDSGFFAFRDPGIDRLMSNWFIAAEPDSVILQRLYQNVSDYFAHTYFFNQGSVFRRKVVMKLFKRRWTTDARATLHWHSWFARKILRAYPYFIFHYTFNKLILTDPECARLWSQSKPFPADIPHRMLKLQSKPDGLETAKRDIDSGASPLYKLSWKVDTSNAYWTAVLAYLEKVS